LAHAAIVPQTAALSQPLPVVMELGGLEPPTS
jgi:hypothetical protein